MQSHEVDYQIVGDGVQMVEVELDPGETVIAEAGAMVYMEQGIQFATKMGDGSEPNKGVFGKLLGAGKRLLTGESLFMTHFTNEGAPGKAKVGFSAPYPGTIKAIDLSGMHNNEVIVQRDGFLCAALGTRLSIHLSRKIGAGFFGGEGFVLQKLQGDGMAFVHAGGTIVEKSLNNELLTIDNGCIVAYESRLDYDIKTSGGLKSMIFGGEGLFMATLRGTGKVWLQSMPIRKMIQALAPGGENSSKESSGGLASLFES